MIPLQALLIARNFNDWHKMVNCVLTEELRLIEIFELTTGRAARRFSSVLTLLRLDRIYVRGFEVKNTPVHQEYPWSRMSDHAALSANIIHI